MKIDSPMRTALFAAMTLAIGNADAQQTDYSFRNDSQLGLWENTFMGQDAARCHGYVGEPDFAVRDLAELRRMCDYLDAQYRGMEITHYFKHNGQTVYCVDFESQPSVRRQRALGNKVFDTPPPAPKMASTGLAYGGGADDSDLPIEGLALAPMNRDEDGRQMACDGNSVPYALTMLDELAQFSTFAESVRVPKKSAPRTNFVSKPAPAAAATAYTHHEYAAVFPSTVSNYGAGTYINVWKPYVESKYDFSLSQLWVSESTFQQSVEVGWSIYPNYNKNGYDPELFVAYTPDGYETWCNQDCADFVRISGSGYYPGMKVTPVSTTGGDQIRMQVLVQKYPYSADGNWWVAINGQYIGYFPKSVFGTGPMATKSTELTFGGEIYDQSFNGNYHTNTDMGSGAYSDEGFRYAAYQRNLAVIKTDGLVYSVTGLKTDEYTLTDSSCYDVEAYYGSESWDTYMYMGGPGYNWPWCIYLNPAPGQ